MKIRITGARESGSSGKCPGCQTADLTHGRKLCQACGVLQALGRLPHDIRCTSCFGRPQRCGTCRQAQEFENQRASMTHTPENGWLS